MTMVKPPDFTPKILFNVIILVGVVPGSQGLPVGVRGTMLECIRRPSATGAVFCNLRGATGSWRRRHRSRPLRRKAVLLDICRRSCRGPGPYLYGQVMLLHQLRNTYSMITTQGKRQFRCQFPATHCWRARPNRIKGLVSRSFSGLEGGFAFRSAF